MRTISIVGKKISSETGKLHGAPSPFILALQAPQLARTTPPAQPSPASHPLCLSLLQHFRCRPPSTPATTTTQRQLLGPAGREGGGAGGGPCRRRRSRSPGSVSATVSAAAERERQRGAWPRPRGRAAACSPHPGAAAADRGAVAGVPAAAAAVSGQDVLQVHLHPAARRGGGKAAGEPCHATPGIRAGPSGRQGRHGDGRGGGTRLGSTGLGSAQLGSARLGSLPPSLPWPRCSRLAPAAGQGSGGRAARARRGRAGPCPRLGAPEGSRGVPGGFPGGLWGAAGCVLPDPCVPVITRQALGCNRVFQRSKIKGGKFRKLLGIVLLLVVLSWPVNQLRCFCAV